MKLIWCTASVNFFPFHYTAEKFMQSNVIWNNCMISLYGILSVMGASVSHINDLCNLSKIPLPVLEKHAKMTDKHPFLFPTVFLLITHLVGCWGIDWNLRRLMSGANPEDSDIPNLNSDSYSLLKISLPISNPKFSVCSLKL